MIRKIITISLMIFFLAGYSTYAQEKIRLRNDTLPTALLVIDIQDFYFPGGKSALVDRKVFQHLCLEPI